MKSRVVALLFLLICLLPLSGCWDQLPLSEITIPFGMGLDLDDAHQRVFTFSQPNFSPYAQDTLKQLVFIADNLDRAVQEYEKTSRGTVVLGQLRVVLLSEAVAKESIADITHDLAQTAEVGLNTLVIVTQGGARDMLALRPPENTRISTFSYMQLENLASENRLVAPNLWRVRYALETPGIDPSLPYFVADMATRTPRLAGLAIFKHDRMIDILTPEEALAYQILTEKVSGLPISVDLPAQGAAFHALLSRSTVDYGTSITEEGEWHCNVGVKITADLQGIDNLPAIGEAITKQAGNQQISALLNAYLQELLNNTLRKLIQLQVDPLGISQRVRAQHAREFDASKWREHYAQMRITLDVKTTIRRMGTLR